MGHIIVDTNSVDSMAPQHLIKVDIGPPLFVNPFPQLREKVSVFGQGADLKKAHKVLADLPYNGMPLLRGQQKGVYWVGCSSGA